jgi:uncharacterized membrane protein YvlD (DUF360 family)
MKFLYSTIINALLFYFFISVFNGIQIGGANNNLLTNILAGLIFGALIASIPILLKFFKLPVNSGSTFLLALIIVFIFLFLLQQQVANLGSIENTVINFGPFGGKSTLKPLQTMVAATVTISLGVLGLRSLSDRS